MIIFDLDLTIWECFDKKGNNIWAKQLIPPFKFEKGIIYDDVGSNCSLRRGILEYIRWLYDKNNTISYCSIGAYKNLPSIYQPSILLLKKYDLMKFFNGPSILEYKTFDKINYLKKINEKSIFYDDNDKILEKAFGLENITPIDAKKIMNWEKLIMD